MHDSSPRPKNITFYIGFFLLVTSQFATAQTPPLKATSAFRVVIDPGHGGTDLGTSRDSFIEAKIVYDISLKIYHQLMNQNKLSSKQGLPNIDVQLTRSPSQGLSLEERANLANKTQADLFISLHANSSNSKSVSGMEFYFGTDKPLPYRRKHLHKPDTRQLASINQNKPKTVVEKIKSDLVLFGKLKRSLEFSQDTQKQTADKKSVIRRAPFYVIENTLMPSVLIEVGFISNRREAKKLASSAYQNEIAQLLTQAILRYKEKSDKKLALIEN